MFYQSELGDTKRNLLHMYTTCIVHDMVTTDYIRTLDLLFHVKSIQS